MGVGDSGVGVVVQQSTPALRDRPRAAYRNSAGMLDSKKDFALANVSHSSTEGQNPRQFNANKAPIIRDGGSSLPTENYRAKARFSP